MAYVLPFMSWNLMMEDNKGISATGGYITLDVPVTVLLFSVVHYTGKTPYLYVSLYMEKVSDLPKCVVS